MYKAPWQNDETTHLGELQREWLCAALANQRMKSHGPEFVCTIPKRANSQGHIREYETKLYLNIQIRYE